MKRISLVFLSLAATGVMACQVPMKASGTQSRHPEEMASALMEVPPAPRSMEYHGMDPAGVAMVVEQIQKFEAERQSRSCSEVQFLGYDVENVNAAPVTGRVKALALSTCGPSYYWFDQTEHGGRLARLSIDPRKPGVGDRLIVPGAYGKWELNRRR